MASETHQIEVLSVEDNVLRARVRIRSRDEVYLWISPAYFLCELCVSAESKNDDTVDTLTSAGFFAEQEAEDDDERLEELNEKAKAFISKLEVGPVQDGKVKHERPGAAMWVERTDPDKAPYVDVTITVTKPELLEHLKPGTKWENIPTVMGSFPR